MPHLPRPARAFAGAAHRAMRRLAKALPLEKPPCRKRGRAEPRPAGPESAAMESQVLAAPQGTIER